MRDCHVSVERQLLNTLLEKEKMLVKSLTNILAFFNKLEKDNHWKHCEKIGNATVHPAKQSMLLMSLGKKANKTELVQIESTYRQHIISLLPNDKYKALPNWLKFADNYFKFDVNGVKSPKGLKNAMGKGEIARNKQFLLFTQCFPKTCAADTLKLGLVSGKVKHCCVIKG